MSVAIIASFTDEGVPLTSPSNTPTIRIRRTDTGALVVTDSAMTELGDGNYKYDFSPSATLQYSIRADGDPTAAGQTTAEERYVFGALSGVQVDAIETTIPDIETDTQDIQSRLPASLVSGRMDSDVGNMQTDVLDAAALAASAVTEIDTLLSTNHGGGAWAGLEDWTTAEKNQIRYRLGLDGTQATPTTILGTLELIRKLLNNRQELANGTTANLITYDDDDTTPIATSNVTDSAGAAVVNASGSPAKRSRGT